jgi:hypothetical protein
MIHPMLSVVREGSAPSISIDEGMITLPIRPLPIRCMTARVRLDNGQLMTAITRIWRDGDTPRCRLCPVCTADDNLCVILTNTFKPGDVARSFSIVGTEFQAPA